MGGSPFEDQRGSTMMWLAVTALLIAGGVNCVDGLVGVAGGASSVADARLGGLDAPAWTFIAYGVLQASIGLAVFLGTRLAQFAGIVIAGVNAAAHLVTMDEHPAWSLAIVALDGVV